MLNAQLNQLLVSSRDLLEKRRREEQRAAEEAAREMMDKVQSDWESFEAVVKGSVQEVLHPYLDIYNDQERLYGYEWYVKLNLPGCGPIAIEYGRSGDVWERLNMPYRCAHVVEGGWDDDLNLHQTGWSFKNETARDDLLLTIGLAQERYQEYQFKQQDLERRFALYKLSVIKTEKSQDQIAKSEECSSDPLQDAKDLLHLAWQYEGPKDQLNSILGAIAYALIALAGKEN